MATKEKEDIGRERDRFRGRGRGAFVHFYEDMGTSSTEEGHEKFVAAKSKWDAQIAAEKKRVAAARAKLNEYQRQYDEGEITLKEMLSQFEKVAATPVDIGGFSFDFDVPSYKENPKLVPVRVVNGNNVEGVYHLPKQDVDKLNSGPLNANYVDGGKYFNLEVNQGGRIVGQEMHDLLRTTEQGYIKQYNEKVAEAEKAAEEAARAQYEAALRAAEAQKQQILDQLSGQISEGRENLSEFSSQLSTANANISVAEKQVKASQGLMAAQLNNIKASHKEKEGIIREIFSNMGIDKGDYQFTEEGKPELSLAQVKKMMEEKGLPDKMIMSNGEIDEDKVDILATFLVEQMLAQHEQEQGREGKEGKPKRKSSFEEAMEDNNAAA